MTSRISFQILKEQWGEYELEDGLLLKARFTVAFMEGDGAGVRFSTADQIFVHADQAHQGHAGDDLQTPNRTGQFTGFRTVRDPRSIYLLDDGTVMDVRQKPVAFHRTNAFDPNGAPVIQAEWSVSIKRQADSPSRGPS